MKEIEQNNKIEEPLRQLSIALAKTDNPELIRDFLVSILTPKEVDEVAKRWALVLNIYEGKSQRKIAEELGLSLCKITRGSKQLKIENSPFKKMVEKWLKISASDAKTDKN